jgi:hypothetical protein
MADFAKELHRSTKLMTNILTDNNAIFWIINQPGTKIGEVSYLIPKGGERLSSYCSLEMRHMMGSDIYFGNEFYGNFNTVRILKNRVSGRRGEIPVCTSIEHGISDALSLMMHFQKKKKIKKPQGSSWQTLDTPAGEFKFQNEAGFLIVLNEHPELLDWMKKEVVEGKMI